MSSSVSAVSPAAPPSVGTSAVTRPFTPVPPEIRTAMKQLKAAIFSSRDPRRLTRICRAALELTDHFGSGKNVEHQHILLRAKDLAISNSLPSGIIKLFSLENSGASDN